MISDKIFQSYLIVGTQEQTDEQVVNILKSIGIKIDSSPDISQIEPQKSISIEAVRELKSTIYQKPFNLKYKVIIIKEADKLTIEAQNALLKVLEEPPAHAIIFLLTTNAKSILETIKSRTVIINAKPQLKSFTKENTPKNQKEALLQISTVTNPLNLIDTQINENFQNLLEQIKTQNHFGKTVKAIEFYKEAKLMINANINPKFVIANTILNT